MINCHGFAKNIFLLTDCSDEFYGYNCKKTCSLTCKIARRCDRITGSCNDGCLPGWKGSMCEHGIHCYKYCVLKLLKQKIDIHVPLIHCIGNNCVNKVNNGFPDSYDICHAFLHSIECKLKE